MAQAKIALTPPQTIPLDKLVISDANVRQVKGGVSIELLADSIARCGLLQSLSVRPVLDAVGRRDRQLWHSGRRPPLPRAHAAGEAEEAC